MASVAVTTMGLWVALGAVPLTPVSMGLVELVSMGKVAFTPVSIGLVELVSMGKVVFNPVSIGLVELVSIGIVPLIPGTATVEFGEVVGCSYGLSPPTGLVMCGPSWSVGGLDTVGEAFVSEVAVAPGMSVGLAWPSPLSCSEPSSPD
jgi:hypothetical protein